MGLHGNALFGLALGALIKLWDDIHDMYGAESVNPHAMKLIEVIMVIMFFKMYQSDNYFVQVYVVLNAVYAVFCPDAYFAEPYFAALTLVFTPLALYKAIVTSGPKSLKLTVLFLAIGVINVFSFFGTEYGDWDTCETLVGRQLSFPGLEEDMEVGISKLAYRLINMLFCGFMLWRGNDFIVNCLGVKNTDFRSLLPAISCASMGYFGVSVINQANMIYLRGVDRRKTHDRSLAGLWSTILGRGGKKTGTGTKKKGKRRKGRRKKSPVIEEPAGDFETTISAAVP